MSDIESKNTTSETTTFKESHSNKDSTSSPSQKFITPLFPEFKSISNKKAKRKYRLPHTFTDEGDLNSSEDNKQSTLLSQNISEVSTSSTTSPQGESKEQTNPTIINPRALFEDLKEIRKIRSRPKGIDAQLLLKSSDALINSTPNAVKKKKGPESETSQRKDVDGLLAGFTSVNKTLDANQHMEKFIEQELAKKRRKITSTDASLSSADTIAVNTHHLNPPHPSLSLEDELFSVPEHLKIEKPEITEGSVTVSTSMLTAIPEVNLGPDTKLKAIEKTEKFREKLRALHMSTNSQLRERALAFHNNPYPSMRWRISRKTRENLYDLNVADEILNEQGLLIKEQEIMESSPFASHASFQSFSPSPSSYTKNTGTGTEKFNNLNTST